MSRTRTLITADVSLGQAQHRKGAKGPYLVVQGSTIDGVAGPRTVMAFGERCSLVDRALKGGGRVRLVLARDGGSYVVVGKAQPRQGVRPKPVARSTDTLLAACLEASGHVEHAVYGA